MRTLIVISLLLFSFSSHAQVTTVRGKGYILPVIMVGKDSMPSVFMDPIVIVSKRQFKNFEEQYRFMQLRSNIITVYPYAKRGGALFNQIQTDLSQMDRRRDRHKYLKEKQKEMSAQFDEPLKNLTITQGKLLVKLISRETGENVYDLIKEYKSGTTAFYWNTMGKFLGYDLKTDYDPQEDRDIEIIMRSLEGNTQL